MDKTAIEEGLNRLQGYLLTLTVLRDADADGSISDAFDRDAFASAVYSNLDAAVSECSRLLSLL